MSDFEDFQAKKRAGFVPPEGPNRCQLCAFHIHTQGHRDGCPRQGDR